MVCNQYYRQELLLLQEQWECYLRDEGPHQPPRQHHCDECRQVVVNEVKILKEEKEKVFNRQRALKPLGWSGTQKLCAERALGPCVSILQVSLLG